MADIYFVSDTHFGHENIIKFCDRPFKTVKEMDERLAENWARTVRSQDHVYHLGDVTMERKGREEEGFIKFMRKLPGHLRLVMGNHDHFPTEVYLEAGFEKIYGTWRGIANILLSHIPIHPSGLGGCIANVHGHIHQHDSPAPQIVGLERGTRIVPYVNICVERTEYRPIHLDELLARIRSQIEREHERIEREADTIREASLASGERINSAG